MDPAGRCPHSTRAPSSIPICRWIWRNISAAINAVLLAAYGRETISGFYVAGFHPAVALQDKSTSVRGKPAQQMLGYWYPRITGR